jgi:hypothetical protein
VVTNGDLEIVGSREERPFCRGEKVPAIHVPLNCSDTHRWSETFTAEERLLVKEEEVVVEGYLWHGNRYVRNILIVVSRAK